MVQPHDFYESWRLRIQRDLSSFSDPGTLVTAVLDGRTVSADWVSRSVTREATFSISLDQGVTVNVNQNRLSYRSFISSPELADLRSLAQMILQSSTPHLFVPTRAVCDDPDPAFVNIDGPAIDVITSLLDQNDGAATRVIMVTGDAGAGKTRVLQELVRLQADKYSRGQTTRLLLYVNAQGRALSRLNEALATELQDLRVNLTYHSISVLARLGVLVPVIDGFDELLGVSGYDDAFSSLAGFLEQLHGEGQLLASARSVYYEEEFLSRASPLLMSGTQAWEHTAVRVAGWNAADQEEYLSEWIGQRQLEEEQAAALRAKVARTFAGENSELATKPLFFTRTLDLLYSGADFLAGEDLLQRLVQGYLDRERTEKLLDRQSQPLLSERQLAALMQELAEEMWNQETRELDYQSVRDVAEYVLESEEVSEAARQIILERIPTLAFLAQSDSTTVHAGSFEHELFFFYFLARSLAEQLANMRGDMRIVLSRSALPEYVADRVAGELASRLSGELQRYLDYLYEAGRRRWHRTDQVRENSGRMVMALLRQQRIVAECLIQGVVFPGSHLRGVTMEGCRLDDVMIRRTDLAETRFHKCVIKNVLFVEPQLRRGGTVMQIDGLGVEHVIGLRIVGVGTVYDPEVIASALAKCGAWGDRVEQAGEGAKSRIPQTYINLLERLMRAYRKANPVSLNDDNLRTLFEDEKWQVVEELLLSNLLIKKEVRHPSGRSIEVLRRQFLPEQFMAGLSAEHEVSPNIRKFWHDLENTVRNG